MGLPRGLRRFFVDAVFSTEGALLQLSLRETYHLSHVLRLKAGDACQVFNRSALKAEAVVEAVSGEKGARLRLKKIHALKENPLFLKVAQALPQKRKLDELVDRAEELGVRELWVLETQRNGVKMSPEARTRVRERWERIVIEAAKQSGSPVLTRVEGPIPFKKVIQEKLESSDQGFLFHPDPRGLLFSEMIENLKSLVEVGLKPSSAIKTPAVFLFFGPEGGFTEEEVRLAESRGVQRVFLGDSTLRLETAFVSVLGALRFLLESPQPGDSNPFLTTPRYKV